MVCVILWFPSSVLFHRVIAAIETDAVWCCFHSHISTNVSAASFAKVNCSVIHEGSSFHWQCHVYIRQQWLLMNYDITLYCIILTRYTNSWHWKHVLAFFLSSVWFTLKNSHQTGVYCAVLCKIIYEVFWKYNMKGLQKVI